MTDLIGVTATFGGVEAARTAGFEAAVTAVFLTVATGFLPAAAVAGFLAVAVASAFVLVFATAVFVFAWAFVTVDFTLVREAVVAALVFAAAAVLADRAGLVALDELDLTVVCAFFAVELTAERDAVALVATTGFLAARAVLLAEAVAATVFCFVTAERVCAAVFALATLLLDGTAFFDADLAATTRPRAGVAAAFLGCGVERGAVLPLVLVDLSFFLTDDIRAHSFLFRFGDGTHSFVAGEAHRRAQV